MSEQLTWWPFPWLDAPGRLTQPILPDWSLQRVEVNFAGNAEIERDVVGKVASYGKQLGILTEAVLALADGSREQRETRVARLREIAERVSLVKAQHKSDLAAAAKDAMASLAKADPAAARRIGAEYGRRNNS